MEKKILYTKVKVHKYVRTSTPCGGGLPVCVCVCRQAVPERKGFWCILPGGDEEMRTSRLTSEAPVGPRKASGVRHMRRGGALSGGGARRDRSNISGLAVPRPFTCGPV